jgi:hypothetical protein
MPHIFMKGGDDLPLSECESYSKYRINHLIRITLFTIYQRFILQSNHVPHHATYTSMHASAFNRIVDTVLQSIHDILYFVLNVYG